MDGTHGEVQGLGTHGEVSALEPHAARARVWCIATLHAGAPQRLRRRSECAVLTPTRSL
jgi:hypothetical protein